MIRHVFRLAIRNLIKRKFYTGIEIVSLTIGMVAFVLIGLYLQYELSFDRFFTHTEKIYRVNHVEQGSGKLYSGTSSALGYHAAREIPAIDKLARVFYPYRMQSTNALVEKNVNTRFYEDNLLVVDSTFFEIFDFQFVEGDPSNALKQKDGIVISEKISKKYFGNKPALNQVLRINNQEVLSITGVVNVPDNTHLDFDFIRPVHHNPSIGYVWNHTLAFTYVKVNDKKSIDGIQRILYQIVQNNLKDNSIEYLTNYRHRLQPLADIHHEVLDWDIITATPRQQLWMVSAIALAILLLAIVNFVNLSTARSSERTKEVGMSKILGGQVGQLRVQYLGEVVIISLISGLIGYVISYLLVPLFNTTVTTNISTSSFVSLEYVLLFFVSLILIGLVAGLYPAWILLRTKPVSIIKRTSTTSGGQQKVREALVVLQFALTFMLVSIMLLISKQLKYMQQADLGYDKEHLLVVRVQEPGYRKYQRFKNELLKHKGILRVAAASTTPGSETGSTTFRTEDMQEEKPKNFSSTIRIDPDFLEVLDIELIDGRKFTYSGADRRNAFILNETAVKQFGLDDPLHENFGYFDEVYGRVIGVVEDFHFATLDTKIEPLVMITDSVQAYRYCFVKISPYDIESSVEWVEEVWKEQNSEFPLEYFFQDEHFDGLYKQQEQAEIIISMLGITALVLSGLGLFGLSSFSILKRTREIGIRKIIGSSSAQIVRLLSWDFLKLILVAYTIALPISWVMSNVWLERYAYRTVISIGLFAITGTIILAVAIMTVSGLAIKASMRNPVETLRNE